MNIKTIGIIGLCITVCYIIGFSLLFFYNPRTFEAAISATSIASFNLTGVKGQLLAAYLNYLTIGMLNAVFIVGLVMISKNTLSMVLGKALIGVAGLLWTSFGITTWDPTVDKDSHSIWIRLSSMFFFASIGLVILGIEFKEIVEDKFLRYYTLTTGLVMILVGLLGLFVFDGSTLMIRINISLTFYFVWFGVFGLRTVQKASAQR